MYKVIFVCHNWIFFFLLLLIYLFPENVCCLGFLLIYSVYDLMTYCFFLKDWISARIAGIVGKVEGVSRDVILASLSYALTGKSRFS